MILIEDIYQGWLYRLVYFVLCFMILGTSSVPGMLVNIPVYGPDLIYCLTAVWLVRRPDHLPPYLVVGIFLLRDILLGLPPGLWTAAMLATGLLLNVLHAWLKTRSFVTEWAVVSVSYMVMLLGMQAAQAVALLPFSPLEHLAMKTVTTTVFYPLVVMFIHMVLRIGKIHHGPASRNATWI